MRTLKLHFPDDALPTLDTFLKQTKEARVFRRAQAVRHVVNGQRLQTVSDALQFRIPPCGSGSIALPAKAHRVWSIARAPVARPKSRANWNSTSIAWSIKTPCNMAPSIPSGVVASWLRCWPSRPGSTSAVRASVAP